MSSIDNKAIYIHQQVNCLNAGLFLYWFIALISFDQFPTLYFGHTDEEKKKHLSFNYKIVSHT